jgi:(1->4)-alpha-D-glucan 1-alpha-D-glucosylmutase
MTPRATVRLQLTREFPFDAAAAQIDYYAALGISHFYLSPIFRARAGSTHGYDTVDFHHVSDELGGIEGLRRLVIALRKRGMGAILDIVPNHMGVAGKNNAWWNDVLAKGRASQYAHYFDIDWTPEHRSLHGKVLLPYLDRPYADALKAAAIQVVDENGEWKIAHYDSRWPVSEADAGERGDAAQFNAENDEGRERLNALLERQNYRLDEWRVASERINWRRFFDITELAAMRIEDDDVFDDVHKAIFTLYEDGLIDGVRVDHVDGLAYPLRYCHRLRDELAARQPKRPIGLRDASAYIIVEKIFASHEPQRDWGVAGTTGYDFMDHVGALLHNPAGQGVLDVLWRRVAGKPWEFRGAVSDARRQVLGESFNADLGRVARGFHALALTAPATSHLTYASLKRALVELIVAFPVYRCYGLPGALAPEDAAILAFAQERTMREAKPEDYDSLDFIARCLREAMDSESETLQVGAAIRFQQLTAPIAAKAVEDTVFYREMRLLSRNEVGSDPNAFSMGVDEFHAACIARSRRFPNSLLATATHDHKRGEDARMRLAVLSEDADRWSETVSRWMAANIAHKTSATGTTIPDAVDEYALYQTLVSAWPLTSVDDNAVDDLHERVKQWWTKALREAKRHSSWIAPNAAYEEGCMKFLGSILGDATFVDELSNFVESICAAAALAGLAQTFLRLTTPGVPDLYQGCDFWDFSLVDPDNRRAVDYVARKNSLDRSRHLSDDITEWRNGTIKQRLIATVLGHRTNNAQLYAAGDYVPLSASGTHAAHVIAFERRFEGTRAVCIASRWAQSFLGAANAMPMIAANRWEDTALNIDSGVFTNVLSGETISIENGWELSALLRHFPVALLSSQTMSS